MEGGPPRFSQGFTCPDLLGIPLGFFRISHTGLSPSLAVLSRTVPLSIRNATSRSRNPSRHAGWFRLFRVRSPLLTESLLISLPQGTEMFHFPWCRSEALCIQTPVTPHYRSRVTPFGNPRITVCLPLPEAYRSLPRPSSPTDAKASIVCSYTLDQKIWSICPSLCEEKRYSTVSTSGCYPSRRTTPRIHAVSNRYSVVKERAAPSGRVIRY